MSALRPDYVEWGALATVPGPLRCLRVRERGFVVEAGEGKLRALCDKLFAGPSGGAVRVEPFGHHLVLAWAEATTITSLTPPWDAMGSSPEGTLSIWVPVEREGGDLSLVMAGIYLDNPISLPSGREMYGFPKAWGWPVMGDDACSLDVYGMDYGVRAAPARHPLLEVQRGEAHGRQKKQGTWSHLRELAGDLGDLVGAGRTLLETIGTHSFSQLLLKQIRDVEDGTKAALQQIVELPYTFANVSGGLDLHHWAVTVHPLSSHPLEQELGLVSQTTSVAFHVELDFTIEPGRVIWDAARGLSGGRDGAGASRSARRSRA
jgi:hypothetical protein